MAARLLILIALVAAAAASAVPAAAQAPPNPVDPHIADGSAQAALDKARDRWRELRIRNYRYEVRTTCFCPVMPGDDGWRKVVVRGGVPAKATKATKDLATVPRLFRVIRRAIDARSHRLTVKYGARGVPTQISIDSQQFLADEEQYYSIRRFKRL